MSIMNAKHIVFRKKTNIKKNFDRLLSKQPPVKVFEGTYFECLKWKHEREHYEKDQGYSYYLEKVIAK